MQNNNYPQNNNNSLQNSTKQATKELTELVLTSVQKKQHEQGLVLPKNYNVTNALNFAFLKLTQSGLLNTDRTALANALLDMCVQGLNPAKNQCYFINYSGKVSMMRSYFGDRAACIQSGLIKDIQANVIYDGDEVNTYYTDGYLVVEHKTNFKNMNNAIVGAYAVAVQPDGKKIYDIMPIERIKKSWSMSKNPTNNKLQQTFTDDACKRTVIRHLVKNIFQQSVDDNAVVDSFVQTTDDEYVSSQNADNAIQEVQQQQKQEMATVKINTNTGKVIEQAYQATKKHSEEEKEENEEFVEESEFDNYDI